MRYNKAVYANSATNLGKNIYEIFRHEEAEKIKALNAHLGKRAIYSAQHIEGQGMQLVLAAVFQECLIISSWHVIYILILEMSFVCSLHYHSLISTCHYCIQIRSFHLSDRKHSQKLFTKEP